MQRIEQLSLKAFWDTVEQRLAGCSAEELRAIVRALAQATPATERQAFLDYDAADGGNHPGRAASVCT